ncbi:leucine-rich repeat protein [Pelagirhabdus alkalitolerans]|nr:leucine-rich repeat protein [Pelagirhabdus alkalitolerans]
MNRRSVQRKRPRFWLRQNLLILFSFVLIFNPFFNLTDLALAESISSTSTSEEDFEGMQLGETFAINGYSGSDTAIEIPSQIEGKNVETILMNAFDDENLTSVVIPESVEQIGNSAFANNQLSTVTIHNDEVDLGSNTFEGNPDDLVIKGHSGSTAEAYADANGHTFSAFSDSDDDTAEDFDWEESDGTVTITGYTGADTDLIIPEEIDGMTVTNINNGAFREQGLTSVDLPDSLKEIQRNSFRDNHLTSVELPESLEHIYMYAFFNNDLETLELNENLTQIEGYAFQNNQLTEVDLGENINAIFNGAFQGNQIEEIVIPDSISIIQSSVFEGNQLTSVTMSDTIWSIGNNAFSGNQLSTIDLPESLERIRSQAFRDNQLEEVILPENVEEINNLAFTNNALEHVTIENQSADLDEEAFVNNQEDPTELVIRGYDPSTAKTLAENEGYSFDPINLMVVDVPSLESVDVDFGTPLVDLPLPEEVDVDLNNDEQQAISVTWDEADPVYDGESEGDYTFEGILDLPDDIANPEMLSLSLTVTVTELIVQEVGELDPMTVDYGTAMSDLALPEEVDVVLSDDSTEEIAVNWNDGEPVYDGMSSGSYVFTGTLQSQADFTNPNDIEASVTVEVSPEETDFSYFENSVGTITINGYTGSDTDVDIPAELGGIEVTTITTGAFAYENLTSVQIPDTVTTIGQSAFLDNELTSIDLPENLTHIGTRAFDGNNLESVDIPDSVENISARAFVSNELSEITIGNGLEEIAYRAFYDNALTHVDIPESITAVNDKAFKDNQLSYVTVYNSEVTFGEDVFTGNQSAPEDLLISGYSESTAEDYAIDHEHTFSYYVGQGYDDDLFYITDYLGSDTEIAIPSHIIGREVTFIASNAFYEKSLTSVEIPNTVTNIQNAVFSGNDLTSIEIPESVEHLGFSVFTRNALTDVFVHNEEMYFGSNVFGDNQTNPEDITLNGYFDSTTADYAEAFDHSFKSFEQLVESVTVADITVAVGTPHDDVPLPDEVEVTFDDGSTDLLPVTWDDGDPEYDASTPGDYTFTGALELSNDQLNPDDIEASIMVTVEEATVIEPGQEAQYVVAGETYEIQGTSTILTMPENLPSHTTLVVEIYEGSESSQVGLKEVGDLLTFTFDNSSIEVPLGGTFVLTMGYDQEANPDDIDIYYLNESTEEWEARDGEVNETDQTISIDVDGFSTYGVFEQLETEDDPEGEDPEGDDPEGDDPEEDDPEGDDPEGDDPEGDDPEGDDPEGDDPEGDDPEGDDPEGDDPEGEDPEGDDPEGEDPEGDDPEGEDPEGDDPDEEDPEDEVSEEETVETTESDESDQLPDTNASIFNLLLIGLVFMLTGIYLYWLKRRKLRELKNK